MPTASVEETGFRIRKGGGAFIWPLLERVDLLSLEVMTLEFTTPEVYTKPGVPVVVDGVAQVKVRGDEASMRTAGEQFLGKTVEQIKQVALQTVEGHLRAIVGSLTVEEIYRNRDQFASSVQEVAVADMANMGLHDRLASRSRTSATATATSKRSASRASPRSSATPRSPRPRPTATRRSRSALAHQLGEIARIEAETKIAEANRDFQSRKAEYDAAVNLKRAEADLAYDIQKNRTSQELKKEEIQISVIEKEQQIVVQEREIQRREKELEATVKRSADAERYRIETEAAALRTRAEQVARGEAEAARLKGAAQAEVTQATGTADANIMALQAAPPRPRRCGRRRSRSSSTTRPPCCRSCSPRCPRSPRRWPSRCRRPTASRMVSTGGDGVGVSKLTARHRQGDGRAAGGRRVALGRRSAQADRGGARRCARRKRRKRLPILIDDEESTGVEVARVDDPLVVGCPSAAVHVPDASAERDLLGVALGSG